MNAKPSAWSRRHGIALVGALVLAVALGVNLQMPLYLRYAQAAGYGTSAIAIVFALYAATLVGFLLSLGGVSDRIGRRPVLALAIVTAMTATLLVMIVPSLEAVGVARVLQGLAVGLATSAGTAYAAELSSRPDAARSAARVITATVSGGFGFGALATALAIHAAPADAPLTYGLHVACAALALGLLALLPETRPRSETAWMRKPVFPHGTRLMASAIIPAWTVTGILIAVVPSTLGAGLPGSFSWPALALFLINLVGVAFQPLSSRMAPERSVRLGLVLLVAGMALIAWAALARIPFLLLCGAAVAGSAAYGFIFTGGLTAVSVAAGAERARASAGFFLFAYIGFSGPPLLTGFAFDAFGPAPTLIGATAIIATACVAIGVGMARGPAGMGRQTAERGGRA
jgi:predicted MFS family arabinose efflux permease